MFKSQLEALIVAFELVWKIAKIRFVDDNKPSSAERTGGKRYPKRLWFTVNMDLIDLLFESAPKDYTRVLLRWLGVNIPPATDAEKSLLQILTVFSEGAVYKLIDGESDVIFNLNSLYEKLLSTVDELDINGDKEAKGSLRVLKSALSDGMNPYLKYKSGTVSLSEDTGELQHYSDRVNTFLSLSTSRVLGLDEGGTFGTNGELYTGAGVNSESYIDENGTTDIALNTTSDARFEKRKAMSAQRTVDYKNGTYALAGGVVDPLPEDAPQFVKDYYAYYKTERGYHPRSLNSNSGWNVTSSLSFMNMPILQYSHEIRSAVLLIHGEKAHSCYFSRDAFEKLTGDNKELLIIPGAVHTDLYDRLDVIPFDKMESFFRQYMG